jgi:hypothetical protein
MSNLLTVLNGKNIIVPENIAKLLTECKSFKVFNTSEELADAATNDRKVSIRSDKVMWELLYKIQQFSKGCFLDFHRCMLCIKNDAVLIVVNIW